MIWLHWLINQVSVEIIWAWKCVYNYYYHEQWKKKMTTEKKSFTHSIVSYTRIWNEANE